MSIQLKMIEMIDREKVAREHGILRCDHCSRLCPYCPRLLAVRPDLAWKESDNTVEEDRGNRKDRPSIVRRTITLGKAIVDHVSSGLPSTDQSTVDRRWAICRSCENFDAKRIECRACGCHLDIKIAWGEQKCPIGKW